MIGKKSDSLFSLLIFMTALLNSKSETKNIELTQSTVLSMEDLIEISQILQNETFFQNMSTQLVHHNGAERTMLTIKFRFSSTLIQLLVKFNTNLVEIGLQNYFENPTRHHSSDANRNVTPSDSFEMMAKKESIHEFTSVLVNSSSHFTNSSFCEKSTSEHESISCYKQLVPGGLAPSHILPFILDTITIPLERDLNYMICIKLVHTHNKLFYFFTENMCHAWMISNMCRKNCAGAPKAAIEHQFAYKPMFIVLMYALCASVLIPIAVVSHFQNRAKAKRLLTSKIKRIDMKIKEESASDTSATLSPLLSKSEVAPQQPSMRPTPSLSITASLNDMRSKSLRENTLLRTESVEAEHILSDKPWASRVVSSGSIQLLSETSTPATSNFASLDRPETSKRGAYAATQRSSIRNLASDLNKSPSRPTGSLNPAAREIPYSGISKNQRARESFRSSEKLKGAFETPV
jgi:hypothetical protein